MRRATVRSVFFAAAFLALASAAGARELTFEERVAAQTAIERVYYAHQQGVTRPFEEAVPREVIERKVRAFLERSEALERFWHTTIDEDALRREWQRIERQAAFPDRLLEIYTALGDDPVLIGECFVRPTLVQRMTSSFFDQDERIHGEARQQAEALRGRIGTVETGPLGFTVRKVLNEDTNGARVAEYFVPRRSWQDWWAKDARPLGLELHPVDTIWRTAGTGVFHEVLKPRGTDSCPADDKWDNGPFEDIPDDTSRHAAVWTGSELLVWGGIGENAVTYPAGWRYDPSTDAWRLINRVGAPTPRSRPTGVWTGTAMIVWGGQTGQFSGLVNTGGRYDATTDTWQPTSLQGAPAARQQHTAVWTGTRMIVWGGQGQSLTGDGASYDPATDTWTPISSVGAPSARQSHTAVWTGSEMIVWGGLGASSTKLNTGARYNPSTDTWTALPTLGAPAARAYHSAIWAGTEMILFGGEDQLGLKTDTGGRWSEGAGWLATTTVGAPQPRGLHTAVWTGNRMLVWGGGIGGAYDNGRAYDPATNQWGPDFSPTNTPSFRLNHTAVWTGSRMIVWGGEVGSTTPTQTGGRYDPAADSWTPTSTGGPAADVGQLGLLGASPPWTGTELLFLSYGGPGYAYDPLANTGRVIPPSGRPNSGTSLWFDPLPAWTGSLAIMWGANEGASGVVPGHGLLYNPIGDVWTEMSMIGAPYARSLHSMVWTGNRLLVWGGLNFLVTDSLADGQQYDPATNQWQDDIPTENAPLNRYLHCAFWDGDEMIVYGGTGVQGNLSGGRFHLATNTWTPMAAGTVPGDSRSCVWNGTELYAIHPTSGTAAARYSPVSNTWTPLPDPGIVLGTGSTSTRVWTGTRLVRWAGMPDPDHYTNAGVYYDSTTNTWSPTSLVNAPEPRRPNWAAWIGNGLMYTAGGRNGSVNANSRDGGRYSVNVDAEGDGVPEACDNCPGLANADQADADADAHGDACDTCTDLDGDTFGDPGFPVNTCALDNCPDDANPTQADLDVDGAGDPCDDCTDSDGDAFGNPGFPGTTCATDNCASAYNAVQLDTDIDGVGDLCDVCPSTSNPGQADADGDGAGDSCDCQLSDPSDRAPAAVSGMTASKPAAGTIALSWSAVPGADAYSITRGDLDSVSTGAYGACLAEGVAVTSYSDATAPASGQGFAYLVQAQSYDCGLGSLGTDSTEAARTNGAGACAGNPHTDSDATGESAVFGTTTGALGNIASSDNLVQTITEEVTGGSPATRISRLEHRWTFTVGAGSFKQLHVEGFRSTSTDGDDFRFEYSTDGVNFTAVTLASLPLADNGIDLVGALPAGLTGTVTIRVVDTDRTAGNQAVDSVSLDEVFLRTAP